MELDEMQRQWAVQDQKLDEVLRLNRKLLESQRFSRARSTLQRLRAGLGIELLLNAVAVAALGAFIGNHFGELRFVLPAVALDIAAVAILASSVRQFLLARTLDFTGSVTGSQRSLEALRVVRIQTTQRVLLASPARLDAAPHRRAAGAVRCGCLHHLGHALPRRESLLRRGIRPADALGRTTVGRPARAWRLGQALGGGPGRDESHRSTGPARLHRRLRARKRAARRHGLTTPDRPPHLTRTRRRS